MVFVLSKKMSSSFCLKTNNQLFQILIVVCSEAEFKEFETRFKFKPQLKYGWFHLILYKNFQDLSRRSIKTGFW